MARALERRNFDNATPFTEWSPAIFEEFELRWVGVGQNPVVWGNANSTAPAAAARRKFLRNKSLESKLALDAVPRASHSIWLVGRHHRPRSCWVDCINARPVSRAEFTWTTSSNGRTASWVRGHADRFRLLSSHCWCTARDCACDSRTIFEDSRSQCDLGCTAVSWRMHFRARAAGALL